jgi:hypothetical protein
VSPRLLFRLGLAMFVLGLTEVWVSAVQQRRDCNVLGARTGMGRTPLPLLALLVGAIGIMALLEAWLRH